jgi:DNA mismatch repair protein MutS2
LANLRNIDWNYFLTAVENSASSLLAKKQIQESKNFSNWNDALLQMQEILDAKDLLHGDDRIPIQSIDSYPLWFSRLKKGATLQPVEFKDVRLFVTESSYLHFKCEEVRNALTLRWIEEVDSFKKLTSDFERIFTSDGEVKETASPHLQKLFYEKNELNKSVTDKLNHLVKKHELENVLQDRYVTTREGRWVLPIKMGMQGRFPGIIHDTSNSKQSVFIEPQEVVVTNNQLKEVELKIADEIERILSQLSNECRAQTEVFQSSYRALLEWDIRLAQAKITKAIDGEKPQFDAKTLDLIDLRHPLLVLQKQKVVSNSVLLDAEHTVLLVSGPNAGGKTILLKSVGMAAQMARAGYPLCASSASKIPLFHEIFVSVGDTQNISEGLSTFAAHMKELSEASTSKPYQDLVLVDEICGSTDPEEGAAIARAFLEHIAKNRVFNITTSHLSPLKSKWPEELGVIPACMDYDESLGRPTYKLIPGMSGSSFAWKTAKKMGVPEVILQRALDFLNPEWKTRNQQMEDLEKLKSEALLLKAQAETDSRSAEQMRRKYEEKLQKLENEKLQILEEASRDAEKRVEKFFEEIRQGQQKKNVFEAKAELPQIIKGKKSTAISSAKEFAEKYPPGSEVYARTILKRAIVQSLPNEKGEVTILAGSMRVQSPWEYLVEETNAQPITKSQFTSTPAPQKNAFGREDFVLDLRGMTIEEAVEHIDHDINQALQENADRLKIIHGHGTGALKKAVRAYLSRSPHIKGWQAASPEHGGDGVTFAEL